MPMTLAELRYLVAVADLRHFGHAAERCHITQPTLRSQLRKLEEGLGVQLVERTTRSVTLTPAGDPVVAHARPAPHDPPAGRRAGRDPRPPHPRGGRPDHGTGAASAWGAHQCAAPRHH